MAKPAGHGLEVIAICALLATLVCIVFGQTVHHGFLNYDDNQYVYENPVVSSGFSPGGVGWAFTHVHAGNWHPLTTISHMLDCQFYGLHAGGHHLTNVILHLVAAVLLFLMLREMTGELWRCAFVAAVFAIHPLRVESVAWVAERKDVLSGIFFMLTLWAYVRYVRLPASRGRYALVAAWLALGLMSKPMLVTVPFVLLLLDYWPLGRFQNRSQFPRLLMEKLPLFAISALSCVATIIAQKEAIQPMEHFTLFQRITSAMVAYVVYLEKLFYPSGLAVFYPFLKTGWPAWQIITAIMVLMGFTAGAWVLRRKQPFLVVGWLWYLVMLVPVVGILQVGAQAYADRYAYLPQIGLCIAGTWAGADWTGKRLNYRMVAVSAAAILCVLAGVAYHQTSYWRDNITLWTHTLECTKDNSIAQNNLGLALFEQGRIEEAGARYREALRIDPDYAQFHNNLGNVLFHQGRTDDALAQYGEALRIDSSSAVAHNNLGLALLRLGQAEQAGNEFREALRINPAYAEAQNNLGNALLRQGRAGDAIAQNREALRLNPASAEAHCNLGNALLQQGQTDEAVAQYREALRINPAYAEACYNLGNVLLQQGRTDDAVAQFREAFRIKPDYAEAHYNLGNLLLQQGRMDEAIAQYRETLRINPGSALAQNNLANALFQQGRTDEAVAHYREALRIDPAYAEARSNLGNAFLRQGRTEEAIAETQKALELQPGNAGIQNALAWMLASAPQASLRNGARAVQLALQASQSSGGNNPLVLHTLAAAYAEANDFTNAVATAQKALQLAEARSNTNLAGALRREIKLYEAGHRYEEER